MPDNSTPPAFDPRIMYLFALPGQRPMGTMFQAFPIDRVALLWAYDVIVRLPANMFELSSDIPRVLGMRVCGMGTWRTVPVRVPLLARFAPDLTRPLQVIFSADYEVARAVSDWQRKQRIKPIHVSSELVEGAIEPDALTVELMRDHLLQQIDSDRGSAADSLRPLVEKWQPRPLTVPDFEFKGHFSVTPNHMVLRAHAFDDSAMTPDWMGDSPDDYRRAIAESAQAVDRLRAEAAFGEEIRLAPPRPSLWLIAPSWVPGAKERILPLATSREDKIAVEELWRRIEKQREFAQPVSLEQKERLDNSAVATKLQATRKAETQLFAFAIGLATAGTAATTWRLPPSVNLVSGKIRQLAQNTRSSAAHSRGKLARLFGEVQTMLGEAAGAEVISAARDAKWGIKIVSDAPIEWLSIGHIPLCLHTDVSRLPASPGDILLRQLERHEPLRLATDDFRQVLVISAFEAGDSLDLISKALRALEPEFADRLTITFVRVRSEEEFIAAVNSFDGPIMIFDGHGDHPPGEAGHLVIGKDKVDITSARGRIRLPPIVILSACDTHAADRSSATVANAMLHLGARTVLATLLPIDAQAAATTFAQLIIRLGAYLPTACKTLGRVVRWNEVVGGMLRHQFQYDLLQSLDKEGLIPEALFMKLAAWGRYWSEFNGTDGLAKLAHAIEAEGIMDRDAFFEGVRRTVPLSDAIRYTQLGNPETIWIGSVGDLPEDAQEPFAKFESELVPSWASDGVTNDLLIDFNDAIGMLNEKTGSIPDALRAVRQTAGSLTSRATQSGMFDQR